MLETRQQGGGEVATALVTLARLGCSVACAGKVGDDAFGSSIRRELDQYGVDTRHLVAEPGTLSQASVVLVDRATGQRSILACVPTFKELQASQLPPGLIEKARVLHLDGVSQGGRAGSRGAGPAGRGAGGAGCGCAGPGRRHLRASSADRYPDCLAGLCLLFRQYRRLGRGHRPAARLRPFGGDRHPRGTGLPRTGRRAEVRLSRFSGGGGGLPPGQAMCSTAPISTGCCNSGN